MTSSVIGALRVNLGLDSAQFQKGLKKSQSGMQGFAKMAGKAMLAVGAAATAAAAALAVAVRGAINHADKLSKTAQRIGTTTEALSRMEWAAKLSGVTLSELATGMQRLSRNMVDVGQGAGETAKRAFDALGVSVTDADGKLRDSNAVMQDVAERFSQMEDGAAKTGLAMALFGRAGAQLIPMLNQGKKGLADMAAESDRLGMTISTNTGKAAENFNDTLTRIQAVMQGVVNKVMQAVLPALQNLANVLADPEFATSAQQISTLIIDGMSAASKAVMAVVDAMNTLGNTMNWLSSHDMFGNPIGPSEKETKLGRFKALDSLKKQLNSGAQADLSGFDSLFPETGTEVMESKAERAFQPIIKGANSASSALNKLQSEAKAVFEQTRSPMERYSAELEHLNALLQRGLIDQTTYNRAVRSAQETLDDAKKASEDALEGIGKMGETMGEAMESAFDGVGSSIIDAFSRGGDIGGRVLDDLLSRSRNLLSVFADQALQGLFSGLGGAFGGGLNFAPATTSVNTGLPLSFAGGGYTGNAPRVGGLDGKGGFMAMLHPQETVIDHAGGGTGSAGSVVRIELSEGLVGTILDEAAGQTVQIVSATGPAIVKQSVAANGKALSEGRHDGAMARFGVKRQAPAR